MSSELDPAFPPPPPPLGADQLPPAYAQAPPPQAKPNHANAQQQASSAPPPRSSGRAQIVLPAALTARFAPPSRRVAEAPKPLPGTDADKKTPGAAKVKCAACGKRVAHVAALEKHLRREHAIDAGNRYRSDSLYLSFSCVCVICLFCVCVCFGFFVCLLCVFVCLCDYLLPGWTFWVAHRTDRSRLETHKQRLREEEIENRHFVLCVG